MPGIVAGAGAMPTTVMHIAANPRANKDALEAAKAKAREVGETVQTVAKRTDNVKMPEEKQAVPIDVTTLVEKVPKPDAVAAEAEKGYGLMIVGLDKTVARDNEFHDDVTKLAAGFEGPISVAQARDGLLDEPLTSRLSILVPVNATAVSRRAAEIAVAVPPPTRAAVRGP